MLSAQGLDHKCWFMKITGALAVKQDNGMAGGDRKIYEAVYMRYFVTYMNSEWVQRLHCATFTLRKRNTTIAFEL